MDDPIRENNAYLQDFYIGKKIKQTNHNFQQI